MKKKVNIICLVSMVLCICGLILYIICFNKFCLDYKDWMKIYMGPSGEILQTDKLINEMNWKMAMQISILIFLCLTIVGLIAILYFLNKGELAIFSSDALDTLKAKQAKKKAINQQRKLAKLKSKVAKIESEDKDGD